MNLLKQNSFILQIIGAVLLAYVTPEWGAKDGYLNSEVLIRIGVIFIFFTQGFSLSTKAMINGVRFWPLHLFVQLWIFVGIPLLALFGLKFSGNSLPHGIQLGVFFLSILPTTISSAVALVGQGEGNTAGAIFNTVCANLAAVFILPVWLLWYQSTLSTTSIEVWPVFIKLVKLLLVPFFIGHYSRPLLVKWEAKIKAFSKPTCQGIIVFIVYAAFATSFRDKIWTEVGSETAIKGLVAGLILLGVSSLTVWGSARLLFKEASNNIAAFFTGSQKSLAVGIPYSVAFFSTLSVAEDPSMKQSIIILPLLFYHPAQLLLASILLRFKDVVFGETKSNEYKE